MGHADQEDLLIDEVEQCVQLDFAAVGDRRDYKFCACLFADKLPGNDVGMVFEVRDQDLVARLQARAAEALGNEVDRLRCAAGQDDFVARTGVNELTILSRAPS